MTDSLCILVSILQHSWNQKRFIDGTNSQTNMIFSLLDQAFFTGKYSYFLFKIVSYFA